MGNYRAGRCGREDSSTVVVVDTLKERTFTRFNDSDNG